MFATKYAKIGPRLISFSVRKYINSLIKIPCSGSKFNKGGLDVEKPNLVGTLD